MADSTFLEWPFFEARHKQLAMELRAWVAREVPKIVGADYNAFVKKEKPVFEGN